MKQPNNVLSNGTKIRTHAALDGHTSRIFGTRHPDATGEISGIVGGYGGDVYRVRHTGAHEGLWGSYSFSEFDPVTDLLSNGVEVGDVLPRKHGEPAQVLMTAGSPHRWTGDTWIRVEGAGDAPSLDIVLAQAAHDYLEVAIHARRESFRFIGTEQSETCQVASEAADLALTEIICSCATRDLTDFGGGARGGRGSLARHADYLGLVEADILSRLAGAPGKAVTP